MKGTVGGDGARSAIVGGEGGSGGGGGEGGGGERGAGGAPCRRAVVHHPLHLDALAHLSPR